MKGISKLREKDKNNKKRKGRGQSISTVSDYETQILKYRHLRDLKNELQMNDINNNNSIIENGNGISSGKNEFTMKIIGSLMMMMKVVLSVINFDVLNKNTNECDGVGGISLIASFDCMMKKKIKCRLDDAKQPFETQITGDYACIY